MSLHDSVRDLLQALDYSVHADEGGLLAQRRILGTDSLLYVRCGSVLLGGMYRTHSDASNRVRERFPSAVLRLVIEEQPAPAFRTAAESDGIQLQTRNAFFNDLLDAPKIVEQVSRDERVRDTATKYVEQKIKDEEGNSLPHTSSTFVLGDWLRNDSTSLLVILAPAGHGKTSLTRVLAHRLALEHRLNPDLPVPLLVPFAEYRTLQDFRGLVLRRLEDAQVMFTSAAFEHLLGEGRAILILDGFDELSEEAGYEVSKHNLRQLSEHIAGSGAKVLITSRSAFFRTSRELSDAILRHFSVDDIAFVELDDFDSPQQREFLTKSGEYDERQIDRIMGRIGAESSLRVLAGSPLLLSLIAPTAAEGPIRSRPELYARFLASIFARERERYEYSLSDGDQRAFLMDVARDMYKDNTFVYDKDDLVTYFVDPVIEPLVALAEDTELERIRLREKVSDHALLDSVAGGRNIQFRHPSFRDYFVADWIHELVDERRLAELDGAVARRRFSQNVAAFVADMLTDEGMKVFSESARTQGETGVWNAIKVASEGSRRAGEDADSATAIFFDALAGQPDFSRVDLREQTFRRLNFQGRSFQNANLEDAVFDRCSLGGCDFTGAVIKQTSFLRCKLDGAVFADPVVLLSIKVEEGEDPFIETSQGVRQWLYDQRAAVDTTDLILRAAEKTTLEHAEELVRHVFRKFYPLGSPFWDTDRSHGSLLTGLTGQERRVVHEEVIPVLRAAISLGRSESAEGLLLCSIRRESQRSPATLMKESHPTRYATRSIGYRHE